MIETRLLYYFLAYEGEERLEWFGEGYEQLHIVATYNLLYNATFLVEQGVGYACMGVQLLTGIAQLFKQP